MSLIRIPGRRVVRSPSGGMRSSSGDVRSSGGCSVRSSSSGCGVGLVSWRFVRFLSRRMSGVRFAGGWVRFLGSGCCSVGFACGCSGVGFTSGCSGVGFVRGCSGVGFARRCSGVRFAGSRSVLFLGGGALRPRLSSRERSPGWPSSRRIPPLRGAGVSWSRRMRDLPWGMGGMFVLAVAYRCGGHNFGSVGDGGYSDFHLHREEFGEEFEEFLGRDSLRVKRVETSVMEVLSLLFFLKLVCGLRGYLRGRTFSSVSFGGRGFIDALVVFIIWESFGCGPDSSVRRVEARSPRAVAAVPVVASQNGLVEYCSDGTEETLPSLLVANMEHLGKKLTS